MRKMGRRLTFAEKVYSLCRKIPKGKISTYKIIGKKLGGKGQVYRAVGRALNRNKSKKVPCHRVIKSDGSVGGFAKGAKAKIRLLKKEGIKIKNNKIDLKKYLFKI